MELDKFSTLLFANFNGENLYEIDSFNKRGFSILENSKNGTKKLEFKIVEIKNLNKFLVKEKAIMLEN
ncbi:hypothetical protein [Flavivirga jejuensis]|uniref:Uncharacterized protein n=1 Tax=Flavivirga jejuensis TaxID=870487 RepID=A0ABT8WUW0_9FLAO|nr:hypothetical protein [Flavivirga jejuensis]MDO5976779.1 hypothetical protein [Flavivirga jejuensis]